MSTLLVIDRNRQSLRWLLGSLAPQAGIVGVSSVFAGFRLLRRRRFDAIVVVTAHHDAYEIAVLKWLRQHNTECPVVVLLGAGSAGDAALARKYGAREILKWRPSEDWLNRAVSGAIASPATGRETA